MSLRKREIDELRLPRIGLALTTRSAHIRRSNVSHKIGIPSHDRVGHGPGSKCDPFRASIIVLISNDKDRDKDQDKDDKRRRSGQISRERRAGGDNDRLTLDRSLVARNRRPDLRLLSTITVDDSEDHPLAPAPGRCQHPFTSRASWPSCRLSSLAWSSGASSSHSSSRLVTCPFSYPFLRLIVAGFFQERAHYAQLSAH
jgi:hypothetical protein